MENMSLWFFYLLMLAVFILIFFDDICEIAEGKERRWVQLGKLPLDLLLYFSWNAWYLASWN